MESSNVANFLFIPVEIVLSLIRNPQEASCLLETTFRGQQLQDLLSLQATQQQCDVSALQKVCTSLLSLNDATLAALVPSAIQAASAATRAADLTQTKLKECLDALHMLSGHLKRHSEITSAVAVEMRRQPACQELAIEREFVVGIQAEAAQRAGHIARLRGHCTTLTPFSHVLESLKAEAAQKLQRLSKEGSRVMLPTAAVAHPAAAAPSSSAVTKDRLDNIERGLHAMNAHVNQLVRLQTAAAAAAASPPIEQAVGASNAAKATRHHPVLHVSPEAAAVAPPPRIQEISPGGTEQPEIIRSLSYELRQQDHDEGRRKSRKGEQSQQQQQHHTNATSELNGNPSTKRKAEINLTQSKALRGDAAPSSTTENDDGYEKGSSGANRSLSHPNTIGHSNPAGRPMHDAGGEGVDKEKAQQQEFCFSLAPFAGSSGRRKQLQKEEENPSPTPQIAPNPNNTPWCDANNEEEKGAGLVAQEYEQYEKENIDATQSQGDLSSRGDGGSKEEPEEENEGEEGEEDVPATLPLEEDAEEEAALEEIMDPPPAATATAPTAVPATGPGAINLPGRGFLSQRDSYSPGNTLNPGSGGAHTGSGSGSGVAAAARGGRGAGAGDGNNKDTPVGPSRVAPTPVALLCCPPPLPPPSFPLSSSIDAAAARGGGGGEKRNNHAAGGVAGGSGGGASIRVKRTRFATEAAAATTAFEREKSSSSQDADAELPLSGPSCSGGGVPGTADWKTPGEVSATPLHQTSYHMQHYHQHKSWVPSTIKPAVGGPGGGVKGNQHPPLCGRGYGHDELFPFSQEDSPRVAGAQKGATPMFLNSFPTSGDLGGHTIGGGAVTPATCASWKAGVARTRTKVDLDGSDIKRHAERREDIEEDQGGEEDGCNASNQLRRKTPSS
ncbi:hypothetical protein Ndes2437B_g03461 [Nannochloris sp. 'desiccata']